MSALADRLRASLAAHPYEGSAGFVLEIPEIDLDNLSDAAVLIAVIDAPEPRVILTLRRANLRRHAGQVAFPGGRIDPGDASPVEAALREAWEEIALSPDEVEVVGTGRTYITYSNFRITPVIGVIAEGLKLTPCAVEVAAVFDVPFTHLFSTRNHMLRTSIETMGRKFYEIDWPDYRIWGVTAGIIVDLAPRLADLLSDTV